MRYVYHDGEQTYTSDGNPLGDGVIYQKKTRLDMGLGVAPTTKERRKDMWNSAAELSFETPADCARLLAWSTLAPFCGALPARPAGFLTGASKWGKSTIMDYVITPLARPRRYNGEATAAGIRQEIGNDRTCVIIDEAESHDEESRRRMNDHFALMRQSTFENSPRIVKGTQTGRAQSFDTNNMYLYSAISPGLERSADLNRIFIIDLRKPEGEWTTKRAELVRQFTAENCAAVRAFTWGHLGEIIAATDDIARAIEDVAHIGSRDALLEAMLWAAHWRVWKDELPEEDALKAWLAKTYAVKERPEVQDDAEAMMERLLTEVVSLFDAPAKRYTLEHCLRCVLTGMEESGDYPSPLMESERERYRKTCWQYGLYVLERTRELAVHIRRPNLAKILNAPLSYHVTLSRHALCVHKSHPVTQDGPTKRCVIFSSGILEGDPPI